MLVLAPVSSYISAGTYRRLPSGAARYPSASRLEFELYSCMPPRAFRYGSSDFRPLHTEQVLRAYCSDCKGRSCSP